MQQIFIDDGLPDAKEWDSNYILYDENDLESMIEALNLLEQSERAKSNVSTLQKQLLENSIEKKKAQLEEQASRKKTSKDQSHGSLLSRLKFF